MSEYLLKLPNDLCLYSEWARLRQEVGQTNREKWLKGLELITCEWVNCSQLPAHVHRSTQIQMTV